jgi:hypothetical protein
MLEQAIVDASQLREAALKSAEAAVVEKYSTEVKEAMDTLLEQDPLDDPLGVGGEEDLSADETEVVADIPMAHDPDMDDDEIVVLDLDQIIAAAEADEGVEDENFELDVEEVAAEVGIPLDTAPADEDPVPGNRSDEEIDLNENDLLDLFKELLVVDIGKEEIAEVEEVAEQAKEEEDQEAVVVATSRSDGFDSKDEEAHARSTARLELEMENLKKENNNLKNILAQAKDRLEEINLSNARLLYANRVLQDPSLNEQQKNKIAGMVSNARTVDEAKMVFETLQKTLAGKTQRNTPQSLSEAVSRKSSVILGGNRQQTSPEIDPTTSRWATLAGIGQKK